MMIVADIVTRLAAIQAATGMTLAAVARALKVDPSAIRRWRAGEVTPGQRSLDRLAALEAAVAAGEISPWPERVRAIREALGLTQEALAQRIKVRTETVSRWESGAMTPNASSASALEALERRRSRAKR